MKYLLTVSVALAVIWLGISRNVTFFSPPLQNPVPQTQKVAHSNHCSGCHGHDESGLSLVDKSGNDVNIHDDWQISMMGLSAYDPFWRATLAHEVNQYPTAKTAIESTCLKCHAPLGHFEATRLGLAYAYDDMLTDSLGLDGVSCSACHQQPQEGLGKGHSGNFTLDTNRLIWGQYPNPFQGPMQIYVGFDPVFSDHIYSSGICAGCHTLITETLRDDGSPSGQYFVEQATYHEWLNSSYPAQGKECQSCHLPFIEDGVIIASDFFALEDRYPFGLHQFFGANTAMLELMRDHKDEIGIGQFAPAEAWQESIDNNRISLRNSASLAITDIRTQNDTMFVTVAVRNKTGHKLPSGYPSRLAWLRITLTDPDSGETIYLNGAMDDQGHITGRDHPFEPHHEISRSAGDVQIYELVMADLSGHLTTRLNAASQPFKDNRLLPLGFRKNHPVYDTVAIWGNALEDPDYGEFSGKGTDTVHYHIPLNGATGKARLNASFLYQSIPSRWMLDLFQHDDVPEVAIFKSMYDEYADHFEIIDELFIDDIDLSTTSIRPVSPSFSVILFPNPVRHQMMQITGLEAFSQDISTLRYEILSLNGRILQQGVLTNCIELTESAVPGVYYLLVYQRNKLITLEAFTVL